MGNNMNTVIACAIEIDHEPLFETYEEVPDRLWCEHRETFEPSEAHYCPQCGRERPGPQTYSKLVPSAFSPKALEALRATMTKDLEANLTRLRDFELEVGPLNGLDFMTNIGNTGGVKKPRLFLGKHLTSVDKWSDAFCLQWSRSTVDKLSTVVEEKAGEVGFVGEAKLVAFNMWM